MARKITIELVDDYDEQSAAAETVTFALDGTHYEIDLSSENAAALRHALDRWIAHARPSKRQRRETQPRRRESPRHAPSALVRQWAHRQGIEVSARGRVPGTIIDAYRRATIEQEPHRRANP
ncbi:histone-like nucleoid-structuring protein Lsr2 [Nocardia thailandica]